MGTRDPMNLRERSATGVMLLIALSAAVLSFNTLAEIGNAPGLFPRPWGGWLWAGAVDGFITLGFLSVGGGKRHAVYARLQIAAGFVASLVFQLAHARGIVLPLAVAAVPPLAVVLSVESWWLSKRHAGQQESIGTAPTDAHTPEVAAESTGTDAHKTNASDAGKELASQRWNGQLTPGSDAHKSRPFVVSPPRGMNDDLE